MQGIECILLVDDDPITNFINQLLLEKLGFGEDEIMVTTDGDEAVNIVNDTNEKLKKNNTLLLLFLDINMPALDGFEVLDALNEMSLSHSQIKVYLLTSSQNAKDLQKAKDYKICKFIDKPLKEESVKTILDELNPS
ncbi:CheY-like chemotaxis protein [Catalinimonas alkaloidigena]|uniref:response regulator n=1 Tax=Catalinimonas alkaloidigena TaxID=1075417 RepID=UPI002404B196|nr:response regulator [Catalinimonas alkaloidigena]MDF9795059.1 CheY-like chemotaxis protein [Catalinimonas alkaloidigena]